MSTMANIHPSRSRFIAGNGIVRSVFSSAEGIARGPGAVHLRHYLPIDRQRALIARCRALLDGAVPAYVPIVRGGGKMHVRMLCLGRHWNGQTYSYEPTRTDFDNLPAPRLPDNLKRLAQDLARAAAMTIDPDLCILNYYDADGRMGL